jgi:hypothetical protein
MTGIPLMKLGLTDDAPAAFVKLGNNFMIALDSLPQDLRRRWDQAQSKKANGENNKAVIASLIQEIKGTVGVDALIRAAQRDPRMWGVGTVGEHGENFRSLANEAEASASSEKKKEGVKGSVGHEKARCPYCGR